MSPAPTATQPGTVIDDDRPPVTPSPTNPRSAGRNVFGPVWPSAPPEGARRRLDAVFLTATRDVIYVMVDGMDNYAPGEPCTEDLEPWVGRDGDSLLVTVIHVAHPDDPSPDPHVACLDIGSISRYELLLPAPFDGSTIRDLAVGPIWVPPPDGVAELASLPDGWVMGPFQIDGPTHRLTRSFMPDLGVAAPEGADDVLTQVFGGPSTMEFDANAAVEIRGRTVPASHTGASWMASWKLGADGMTLQAIGIGKSQAVFEQLANGVAVPNP